MNKIFKKYFQYGSFKSPATALNRGTKVYTIMVDLEATLLIIT